MDDKSARMSYDDEDRFIQLCLNSFEIINNKSTFRGLPITGGQFEMRKKQVADEWDNIARRMREITKVDRSVEQLKKKFDNCKQLAKTREKVRSKLKKTGGGRLTAAEQRIVNSPIYTDLLTKLGASATGGEPRADSDATTIENVQAPTNRLRNVLRIASSDSEDVFDDLLQPSTSAAYDEDFDVAEQLALEAEIEAFDYDPTWRRPNSAQQPTKRLPNASESDPSGPKKRRTNINEPQDLFLQNLRTQEANCDLQTDALTLEIEKQKVLTKAAKKKEELLDLKIKMMEKKIN